MLTVNLHKKVVEFLDTHNKISYLDGSSGYQVNNCLYMSTDIEGLYTVQYLITNQN